MKTRAPPLSSKTRVSSKGAKAEEKDAPTDKTSLARFRAAAKVAFSADLEKVRKLERAKKKRD